MEVRPIDKARPLCIKSGQDVPERESVITDMDRNTLEYVFYHFLSIWCRAILRAHQVQLINK